MVDMIDKTSSWRDNMTEPRTLHEGGTGLGLDADTAELNKWDILYPELKENQALREAVIRLDGEVSALHKSRQWLMLGLFVAFALGFVLCAVLTTVGLEALR